MTFDFHTSPIWKLSPLATIFLYLMRPGGMIFSPSNSRIYHKVLLNEGLSFLFHAIFQQHMECKFTSWKNKRGGNKHCKQTPSKSWGSYHTAPAITRSTGGRRPTWVLLAVYDLHIFEDFSLLQLQQLSTSFRIYVIIGESLVGIMQ